MEEEPLADADSLLTPRSFAVQPAQLSKAHLSLGPNGANGRQSTRLARAKSRGTKSVKSLKRVTGVGPDGQYQYAPAGSSAAFVEELQRRTEEFPEPPQAGCLSAETSCSRVHLVDPKIKRHSFPWENQDLLAKRALRTDELHSRMNSLHDKILARKAAVLNEAYYRPMPQKHMSMHRRPSTVAVMDGAREVERSDTMAWRASATEVDPMTRLPTDSELDAMDAVAALAKLQDLETQLLSELSNGRQSAKDRLRYESLSNRRVGTVTPAPQCGTKKTWHTAE